MGVSTQFPPDGTITYLEAPKKKSRSIVKKSLDEAQRRSGEAVMLNRGDQV